MIGGRHRPWLALLASILLGTASWGVQAAEAALPGHCRWDGDAVAESERLLRDEYRLSPHPTVRLPHDLSWTEDPIRDRNWQFQLHSLRYVNALLDAWAQTGERRFRQRAVGLLKDWIADNPLLDAPSPWAWNDHSTAQRARTLVCASEVLGRRPWLLEALVQHGVTLADPGFYVRKGNHALAQNVALLEVGNAVGDARWTRLASRRTSVLAPRTIDRQGVAIEQSVGYQRYDYVHFSAARERFRSLGMRVPRGLDRVDRMPAFLAHATLPNGEYEMLGDTEAERALPIEGTIAEFAATLGASGPRPVDWHALYRREGYLFARTGWGVARPYRDEVAVSLRFGPARRSGFHGHHDGGSLTLYGYGSRLLVDPGKGTYDHSPWRAYFIGRSAHNVVVIEDLPFQNTPTRLVAHRVGERHLDTTLSSDRAYPGVRLRRRMIFSRDMGHVIVEDRLRSPVERRYSQLWHLVDRSRPIVTGARIASNRSRGNLSIFQIAGGSSRIIHGATDPIQGWVSYSFNERVKAPVVVTTKRGTRARFVTLLVPSERSQDVRVSAVALSRWGLRVTVQVGARCERVRVWKARVRIESCGTAGREASERSTGSLYAEPGAGQPGQPR